MCRLSPADRLAALLMAEAEGRLPELLLFWGHTSRSDSAGPWMLSQWWGARFEVAGVTYQHAEGFMMAAKARLFGDAGTERRILAAESPAEAKRLGRQVTAFDDARWQACCYDLVVAGNTAKFAQNAELLAYLLSTAPRILVEASPRDRIWGIGLSAANHAAARPCQWRGRNLLGFALTEVRDRLIDRGARSLPGPQ